MNQYLLPICATFKVPIEMGSCFRHISPELMAAKLPSLSVDTKRNL
jgi:hypothetical protein